MILRLIFSLLSLVLGFLLGLKLGSHPSPKVQEISSYDAIPVTTMRSFVFVISAYKEGYWCERTLRSILEQEYENFRVIFFDDASGDGCLDYVRNFTVENQQQDKVLLFKNQTHLGTTGCLYQAMQHIKSDEIVIPLQAKDWLAHPKVLSILNQAYQDGNVWLSWFQTISYPQYKIEQRVDTLSFYAGLFQKIPLKFLMAKGEFIVDQAKYLSFLYSLSEGHDIHIAKPLVFHNEAGLFTQAVGSIQPEVLSFHQTLHPETDLIVFSCDRPLQLFACLESVDHFMSGLAKTTVLYRATDSRFESGYLQVKQAFPHVEFVAQDPVSRKDFKPLLLNILSSSSSSHVLFGVDDLIVKDFVNIQECAGLMEQTGAYGFYLRLGSHINYSYQMQKPQKVPESIPLNHQICAWNVEAGDNDWSFPNTLDMTIYRKKDIQEPFEKMKYKHPNSLEMRWAQKYQPHNEIGLYFAKSKVVNLPLNVVGSTNSPHLGELSLLDYLVQFEQGFKLDIRALEGIENNSPHFAYQPPFTNR